MLIHVIDINLLAFRGGWCCLRAFIALFKTGEVCISADVFEDPALLSTLSLTLGIIVPSHPSNFRHRGLQNTYSYPSFLPARLLQRLIVCKCGSAPLTRQNLAHS